MGRGDRGPARRRRNGGADRDGARVGGRRADPAGRGDEERGQVEEAGRELAVQLQVGANRGETEVHADQEEGPDRDGADRKPKGGSTPPDHDPAGDDESEPERRERHREPEVVRQDASRQPNTEQDRGHRDRREEEPHPERRRGGRRDVGMDRHARQSRGPTEALHGPEISVRDVAAVAYQDR